MGWGEGNIVEDSERVGEFLTRKSEELDLMVMFLQTLAKALALGRLAGSVETLDDNQGTSSA